MIVMPVTEPSQSAIDWASALAERRKEIGLSQERLAELIDVSQSFVSQLERGARNPIGVSADRFVRLLRGLRWTLADFEAATGLTADTEMSVRISHEIHLSSQSQPIATLEPLPDSPKRLIPMYDACAGYGLESEPLGYIEINVDDVGDVAFKVNGHSMVPTIESGDIVVVHKDVYSFGDVVAAKTNEGLVIKKLITDDVTKLPQLVSNDPDYTVLFEGTVHIIGKVVELRRRF